MIKDIFNFKYLVIFLIICLVLNSWAIDLPEKKNPIAQEDNQQEQKDNRQEQIVIESIKKQSDFIFTSNEILTPNGRRFQIQNEPSDEELKIEFNKLTQEEKDQYYQRRNSILQGFLGNVDSEKKTLFLGRFASYKNKVIKFFTKKSGRDVGQKDLNDQKEKIEEAFEISKEKELTGFGEDEIQKLISKIEDELWSSFRVVSEQNVKGRFLALNGVLSLGIRSSRAEPLGAMLHWSLGIGYFENIETKEKYIEIFLIRQRTKKVHNYMAHVFLGVKVGWLNWRFDQENVKSGKAEGEAVYLPTVLPTILRNHREFSLVSSMGISPLDMVIPMFSFFQYYETHWKKNFFRLYFNSKVNKNICLAYYH